MWANHWCLQLHKVVVFCPYALLELNEETGWCGTGRSGNPLEPERGQATSHDIAHSVQN